MKRFAAEVLFLNHNDVSGAKAALAAIGCDLTIDRDTKDLYSDAVFGMVVGASELPQNDIGSWLATILRGHGADVVEWGYGPPWKIGT